MPFLVLTENRFAHTAVETLVSSADQEQHAPVFLHGPSGSGKTLLAKHAARLFKRQHRHTAVLILNAAEFSSPQGISADFKQLESVDAATGPALIVFEDVQSLEGRTDAQRRLLAAGDEFQSAGCRVIWTATKPPGELRGFLSRLTSRFRAGVLAGLKNPGRDSRFRLLDHFATTEKPPIPLPDDVLQRLVDHSKNGSPSELRAILQQLQTLARHENCDIDADLVKNYLGGDVSLPEPGFDQITRLVARQFGITVSALRSQKRVRELVVPRQIAMYLARRLTSRSIKQIGWYFGRRSHTTVLYAYDRIKVLLSEHPDLRRNVRQIQSSLGQRNTTDD